MFRKRFINFVIGGKEKFEMDFLLNFTMFSSDFNCF